MSAKRLDLHKGRNNEKQSPTCGVWVRIFAMWGVMRSGEADN
jgi:hypothetical protein